MALRADTIVTDATWKFSADGPTRYANEYDGELYDARRGQAGWSSAGFDDSRWTPASVVGEPGGVLRGNITPPMTVYSTEHPVAVRSYGRRHIIDFGTNNAGRVRLTLSPSAGDTVRIKGQTTSGRIVSLQGRTARVLFGVMYTTVPLARLEPAEPAVPGVPSVPVVLSVPVVPAVLSVPVVPAVLSAPVVPVVSAARAASKWPEAVPEPFDAASPVVSAPPTDASAPEFSASRSVPAEDSTPERSVVSAAASARAPATAPEAEVSPPVRSPVRPSNHQ